jgi:hypothetical protein
MSKNEIFHYTYGDFGAGLGWYCTYSDGMVVGPYTTNEMFARALRDLGIE